jgi:N-acyl-D-amino-acid deacylase
MAQTGTEVPAFSALDAVMQQALARYGVKGAALAVVKDGHLLFARGYGWADAEAQIPVQPDSLFRWGSIAKTLTAAAVMRLVEDGKLDLDTPVWNILNQYSPYNGKWGDSRLHGITVRQLLHHTGGWDRDLSGDPMNGDACVDASNATHASFPPSQDTMIRYMLAKRLDFDPGSRFAYSNFGYMLLGRVIEKISGQPYATYVREQVLDPLGLAHIQRGGSHLAGRLPGEVKYYDYPGAPFVNSYLSAAREKSRRPMVIWT